MRIATGDTVNPGETIMLTGPDGRDVECLVVASAGGMLVLELHGVRFPWSQSEGESYRVPERDPVDAILLLNEHLGPISLCGVDQLIDKGRQRVRKPHRR